MFFLEDKLKKKKRKLDNGNEIPIVKKKKTKTQKLDNEEIFEIEEEHVDSNEEDITSTTINEDKDNIETEKKIETTGK